MNNNSSDSLEDELISSGIDVLESTKLDTSGHKGCAFKFNNGYRAIVLNNNLIDSEAEKHMILAHEQQHFEHPSSFYNLNGSHDDIVRKEYLISKMTIRKLVDEKELFSSLYEKHIDPEEIATNMNVPTSLIYKSIEYYSSLESWLTLKNNLVKQQRNNTSNKNIESEVLINASI